MSSSGRWAAFHRPSSWRCRPRWSGWSSLPARNRSSWSGRRQSWTSFQRICHLPRPKNGRLFKKILFTKQIEKFASYSRVNKGWEFKFFFFSKIGFEPIFFVRPKTGYLWVTSTKIFAKESSSILEKVIAKLSLIYKNTFLTFKSFEVSKKFTLSSILRLSSVGWSTLILKSLENFPAAATSSPSLRRVKMMDCSRSVSKPEMTSDVTPEVTSDVTPEVTTRRRVYFSVTKTSPS